MQSSMYAHSFAVHGKKNLSLIFIQAFHRPREIITFVQDQLFLHLWVLRMRILLSKWTILFDCEQMLSSRGPLSWFVHLVLLFWGECIFLLSIFSCHEMRTYYYRNSPICEGLKCFEPPWSPRLVY